MKEDYSEKVPAYTDEQVCMSTEEAESLMSALFAADINLRALGRSGPLTIQLSEKRYFLYVKIGEAYERHWKKVFGENE